MAKARSTDFPERKSVARASEGGIGAPAELECHLSKRSESERAVGSTRLGHNPDGQGPHRPTLG